MFVAVLVLLIGSLVVYRGLEALGVSTFTTWEVSARFAFATIFFFTAASHFAPMRKDLIAMVPPSFPRPDILVFATGFWEIGGALGLLFAATRSWAAYGLIALLVAMFPANISAARRGVKLRGRAPTPLAIRTPMQILFILWAWWVS